MPRSLLPVALAVLALGCSEDPEPTAAESEAPSEPEAPSPLAEEEDVERLEPGATTLTLDAGGGGATESVEAWLLVLLARFADGGDRRYLVPAVGAPGEPLREPEDGDGVWRALTTAVATGASLAGDRGRFQCESLPGLASLLPAGSAELPGLVERRLGVEQSNTSILLGDALILKLYRRLEPGENPELEIGAFLESVGCAVTPRFAGAARYVDGAQSAAALMLQERIAARGDAWAGVLGQLSGADGGPEAAIDDLRLLGVTTAQLHAALAARPEDPAFPVRQAAPDETAAMVRGAHAQLDGALAALPPVDRERLAAIAPRIRDELESALRFRPARLTRIHGDYHLGQVLRTTDGYVVIDFEGEPVRSLAERRAPQPPERDVAGMLRSFDYAARSAMRAGPAEGFDPESWLPRARAAFLGGYSGAAPADADPPLLRAFELEKACYEVRYEAANRPDWLWLPLDALARLV